MGFTWYVMLQESFLLAHLNFRDMRCRNIFIYPGPITTSVGFHLFLSALLFGRNI